MAPAQGLELGLLIGAEHVFVPTEGLAVPRPVIEIQHSSGLAGEVGLEKIIVLLFLFRVI